ncbi:PXA domain-containing protein [Neurospora tetraspora]|uniref:PXA domain-containing protein n=1 Tax=Neurospora tetraspora TaxID=94610 RepID=A0AAE0JD19_9PEZI|nr:PXA domain-containing protein [Neurospora tetraspora]
MAMALRGRDIALAAIAAFIAWGYAVHWFPAIRWANYAFAAGVLVTLVGLLALLVLTSRGPHHRRLRRSPRPHGAAFIAPGVWTKEVAALRARQTPTKAPLYPESPKVSAALDEVLGYVVRDFIQVWYSSISKNPVFADEVDKAIRGAILTVRDRLAQLDLATILTTRLVPILTAHFRDVYEAEKSVRGRKLNRSVTETDELDLAIASKYRDGKLHPAATLSFSDTKTTQQDYLRKVMLRILPKILPKSMLASGAVSAIVREITACAVMFPIMQMLSDPDTWNQLMENYGRSMLQDRSTVRKLRAALDQHASPAPRVSKLVAFPRMIPGDNERKFEKFIRAIRKTNNLSDARRFRSEVAIQLKRDSQQENVDQVYLRRLEMGKRLLDQKVHHLAAGGDRRALPLPNTPLPTPTVSRLENASLTDVLRDPSSLSYFMEYMDRQRLMPLVQFWLVVDGFRNPLEDDGPEGEQLPLKLPPWTDSDRLDLAQIEAAYLSRPELKVPDSSKRTIQEFLRAGRRASPEQYYKARRAVLRAQSAVLEEMKAKHLGNFKKSDLFYKALASEEASKSMVAPVSGSSTPGPSMARASSFTSSKPNPQLRMALRLPPGARNRGAGSTLDLRAGAQSIDALMGTRRSMEDDSPAPMFDDDDLGEDGLADSVQSLEQEPAAPVPDTRVVQAMEQALNNIMEDSQPPTAEDLRASLFGDDGNNSSLFASPPSSGPIRAMSATPRSNHGSVDLGRPSRGSADMPRPMTAKEPEKPSLASLGLVSAASRIGVFIDDDLFADENRFLSDEHEYSDENKDDDEIDEVHEAAPGDLGLAEAITVLSNDIDRLVAQDAVVDSLLKKAELTNNTAELRILRKSKASLQREIRRKELQRQQYVIQESDNSLYGRSTIKIKNIHVGREEDGKEFAMYAIEVLRNAGEKMPAAIWTVTRRYSEFLELHQKLRSQYPSVRNLDFPRRRMVMKLQNDFLQKRRVALEKYLNQLLLLPDVCHSRELRTFLSQSAITPATATQGQTSSPEDSKKDMMTRLYDSVADGMEDILGNIPVLDQLSLAGQNLLAAATNQQLAAASAAGAGDDVVTAAEAEAELNAFELTNDKELEPFVKPICDIFLEVFELNRGNNWLRGRAVVVVLHQLLGGTIERKLRDNVRMLVAEDALLRYIGLVKDGMWPGGELPNNKTPRTAQEKARTKTEASLMLATLVPDLAASVVGRLNAQAASRRIFATFNNERLNAHLAFTFLDEIIDILFGENQGRKQQQSGG